MVREIINRQEEYEQTLQNLHKTIKVAKKQR